MKATAFVTAALIFILYITSGSAYFDMLTTTTEQNVFAYNNDILDNNILLKPISKGDVMERKEQEVKLKLMTYNVHRGIGKDGKLNLTNTAEVIRNSDAAIISLQEVERYSIRTGFRDQIKILSEKLNMNYAYGKSINVLNGEYGNGLLSKYPIEEYIAYDLPSFREQRTILRTVINIDGYRLAVYNTHLGLKEAERKEQLEFILQMMGEETLDYLLMGDMNSKSSNLTEITGFMKDSAEGSLKLDQSTFEEKDVQERIDYIFLSKNMIATDYDVILSEASDHYPVISEVVVRE
ncbi:MAG: endonuclease/exonuclease/phosphatase family protein [Lutisporaceae bacterium]